MASTMAPEEECWDETDAGCDPAENVAGVPVTQPKVGHAPAWPTLGHRQGRIRTPQVVPVVILETRVFGKRTATHAG